MRNARCTYIHVVSRAPPDTEPTCRDMLMRVEWTEPDEARVCDNARGHVKRYAMVAMATENSIPPVESNIRRARSRTRFLKNCVTSPREYERT